MAFDGQLENCFAVVEHCCVLALRRLALERRAADDAERLEEARRADQALAAALERRDAIRS